MIIAHRFIGGSEGVVTRQSVKRTAEIQAFRQLNIFQSSAPRTFDQFNTHPALKRWAILIQSASRTQENYFCGKAVRW